MDMYFHFSPECAYWCNYLFSVELRASHLSFLSGRFAVAHDIGDVMSLDC